MCFSRWSDTFLFVFFPPRPRGHACDLLGRLPRQLRPRGPVISVSLSLCDLGCSRVFLLSIACCHFAFLVLGLFLSPVSSPRTQGVSMPPRRRAFCHLNIVYGAMVVLGDLISRRGCPPFPTPPQRGGVRGLLAEAPTRALLRQALPRSRSRSFFPLWRGAGAGGPEWQVLSVLRSHRILTSALSLLAFPAAPSLHACASPGVTLGPPLRSGLPLRALPCHRCGSRLSLTVVAILTLPAGPFSATLLGLLCPIFKSELRVTR